MALPLSAPGALGGEIRFPVSCQGQITDQEGTPEVDRLLEQLEDNLNAAKLSLKR